jgi:hypothetical protein
MQEWEIVISDYQGERKIWGTMGNTDSHVQNFTALMRTFSLHQDVCKYDSQETAPKEHRI